MNRRLNIIKYFFFCCFGITILTVGNAQDIDTVILPDIIVQEGRLEIPVSDVSRDIVVLTKKDISAMPVESVTELLSYLAGVEIRQRGVHGVQADISIRGGNFEQVLVLINGIKMIDPQTGHHSLSLPLDMEAIERVEVLVGSAARIYGQNAYSGAVNIVTKKPKSSYFKTGLAAGKYHSWDANLSGAWVKSKHQHLFTLSRKSSDGYRYNTDYEIYNAFYQMTAGDFRLYSGLTSRKFGANGFYASPDYKDQYEEVLTNMAALEYHKIWKSVVLKPKLYWRHNKDHYLFIRSKPEIFENNHVSDIFGIEVNANLHSKWGETAMSIELQAVNLNSDNLGNRGRHVFSTMWEHRFTILNDKLDIRPGVLWSHFTDFGDFFYPGLDVGYSILSNLKIFANTGYANRVPTYTEMYYHSPANKGNEYLKPEKAFFAEAGVKWKDEHWKGKLSGFYRRSHGAIDWVKTNPAEPWQVINMGQDKNSGITLDLAYHFERENSGFAGSAYAAYSAMSYMPSSSLMTKYGNQAIRNQLILGIDTRLATYFRANLIYRLLDRYILTDYAVLDARLSYKKKKWGINVDVTNILDEKYKETNLVVMPGRWWRLGIFVKFGE